VETIKSYRNASSEIGDVRPMSALSFSPTSATLATGSWSGTCKLWSVEDSKHIATFKGHTEMVTDVAFHPGSGTQLTDSVANLATCGAETVVRLWPLTQDGSTSLKALALSLTSDSNIPDIAPIATLKVLLCIHLIRWAHWFA
jgi:WD40 repeat protein